MNNATNNHSSALGAALGSNKRSFIFVGFFSLFINLLMLVPPLYMLQIYDRVMLSRSEETLLMLTLILVWMFITLGVLEFVRSRIFSRMANRLDEALNAKLHEAIHNQAINDPDQASAQPLLDLATIRHYLSSSAIFALFDTPWVPIYLGILFVFHNLFGWFAVAAAIAVTVLAIANEFASKKHQQQASTHQMEAQRALVSQLQNAEVASALGMQNDLYQQWRSKHQAHIRANSEATETGNSWTITSKTSRQLFQSLMLGLGAYLAIKGEITAGMVIAGSILMGRALAPLDQLISSWKSFSNARMAYKRLIKLTYTKSLNEPMKLPNISGQISVNNAVLIPPTGEEAVLKGISFSLNPGDTLAILGPSGAGKSTLIKAILGIWPLSAGDIRLDQAELSQWDPTALGQELGYLPQDVELFEGSIAENIARLGEVDDEAVIKAAVMADVDHLIRSLPDGYNTQIGTGGFRLSGGQRQRIGLARALYDQPKLVVLDEPNSGLDEQGEKALEKACEQLKQAGSTIILISHRKHILRLADKMLVLDQGKQHLFGPSAAVIEALTQKSRVSNVRPMRAAEA